MSNPRGRAARVRCMSFSPRKFTKSRARPARGRDAPVPYRELGKVGILEITIRIFKFVWEILPIQPTIQPQA